MSPEKLILIGCDDSFMLSALLNGIQGATVFPNHVISTTRIADLIGIAGTLHPDIIITCFRNNQAALNELHAAAPESGVPLLCLSRSFENVNLQWPPASVVIPFQFDHSDRRRYLVPVINSILHLRSAALQQFRPAITMAGAAMQNNKPDNSRNLSRYVMELDQKAEVLSKIKDRIAELYQQVDDPTRAELISIVNAIKMSLHNNKLWEDFKLYFEQTDPRFLFKLSQKYPYLTAIDLKYCCYIKMNMSNDDIGNLLGINQESVRTHKYRLKKKMSLAREQDLRNYLRSVESA